MATVTVMLRTPFWLSFVVLVVVQLRISCFWSRCCIRSWCSGATQSLHKLYVAHGQQMVHTRLPHCHHRHLKISHCWHQHLYPHLEEISVICPQPDDSVCCKLLAIQLLLKEFNEMDITGLKNGAVGMVVHNLPAIEPKPFTSSAGVYTYSSLLPASELLHVACCIAYCVTWA